MKKQKIREDNLYRGPLRDSTYRAITTENFRDSVERFLTENYAGAFELETTGVFNGFVRLIPVNAASFLTSVFRTVCLSSVIRISIHGEYDSFTVTLSFPKTVKFDREAPRTWVSLSESSGFNVFTGADGDRNVMRVTTRVYTFATVFRAISAFADFFEALTASENAARLQP